ncbi:MAG: hypothetical protein QW087_07125 [Methanomassiliicoccales archaeon]
MKLQLRIIEGKGSGVGIIEILQNKGQFNKPIIGYISYDSEEKKRFFIDALLKGGKFGEVI